MLILMVCLGNICRSPTAEAALVEALEQAGLDGEVTVDSAGTGDWHLGDPPDPRMVAAAADEGLTLRGRARQVSAQDFREADLLLAADAIVRDDLLALAPDDAARAKVRLFREFEETPVQLDIPDPYYGGPAGFTDVVTIARAGARGLVHHLAHQPLG